MIANRKEPFVRIIKRGEPSKAVQFRVRFWSLVFAFVVSLIFILSVGHGEISVGNVIEEFVNGTFGRLGNSKSMSIQMWDTALFLAKLLCVAVALAPAFKMHFWNIGAEGQMVMGGLVAALFMHDLPVFFGGGFFSWLLVILLSMAAGALWGLIPAFCKAQWGTNETLFTLMLNYVAMKVMDYFFNLWKGRASSLATFDKSTWLPTLFGKNYGLNVVVFLVLAFLMYFYLTKTKHGYEIAVVGESPNTARYAGISVKWVTLRTMALSGALCGLCGALTVGGQTHCISYSGEAVHSVTNGYGFTAIIVAWLGNFNTIAMIFFSFLVIFMTKGAAQLGNKYAQYATGANNILTGIVLFSIIGGAFFMRYKLVFCDAIRIPCEKFLSPIGNFMNRIETCISKFFQNIFLKVKGFFKKIFQKKPSNIPYYSGVEDIPQQNPQKEEDHPNA